MTNLILGIFGCLFSIIGLVVGFTLPSEESANKKDYCGEGQTKF